MATLLDSWAGVENLQSTTVHLMAGAIVQAIIAKYHLCRESIEEIELSAQILAFLLYRLREATSQLAILSWTGSSLAATALSGT
jgi:hypothetical protein